MNSRLDEMTERLAAPLYGVAILLLIIPAVDFISGVLPLRFDNIEWRFASAGLLSGFVLTPLLGMVLAMLVAMVCEHPEVQRVLAVLNLAMATLLALLMVGFLLDIVQLRNVVQPESRDAFNAAAWKAALKHFAFTIVLGWLGRRGLQVARRAPRAKSQSAAIVIGA